MPGAGRCKTLTEYCLEHLKYGSSTSKTANTENYILPSTYMKSPTPSFVGRITSNRNVTLCTIMASPSAMTVGQAHKIGCYIATPLLGLTPKPSKLPNKRELLCNQKFCLCHYYRTVKAIRFNTSRTI
jgi:hypothetical protein